MALCIGGLLLFGIGGGSFLPSPQDTILKVDGYKITLADYTNLYRQLSQQKENLGPEQQKKLEAETIQELIREAVFYQEAKRYGIEVTDQELQMMLASVPAFQKDGQFDLNVYAQTVVQRLGVSPKEFEKSRKKGIAAQKLNQLIAASVHVPHEFVEQGLQRRLALETDKKKKKELQENPDLFAQEIRSREVSLVFNDWLNQINASLSGKIKPISADMKRLIGGAQ